MTAAAAPPDPGGDPGPDPWYAPALPLTGRLIRHRQALDGWRQRPWLALGVGLLMAMVVAVGWWLGRPSSAGPIDGAIPFASAPAADRAGDGPPVGSPPTVTAVGGGPGAGGDPAPAVTDDTVPAELVVHVAGAVARPGIVRLAGGSRVVDAVEAAGGASADADLDQLNLAAPLADGLQIRVPHQGEILPVPAGPVAAAGGGRGGGVTAGDDTPAVVDLNRATAAELEQLPGIGPSLAAAIVTWRQDHGGFRRVDDLLDVPGIGPAKLANLADHVVV